MLIPIAIAGVIAAGLIGFWYGRFASGPERATLERSVAPDRSSEVGRESASKLDIERALADLRLGVVVVGPDGKEAYRNNRALQYATGRHGDALVEAALERAIDSALVGLSIEENVEVYGPPARSLLIQASPTYDDGAVSGAVGVIDDVTESRYLDRVRSDFVANVSHELKTPVGAMSVLAETIADAEDPEVVDRLADRMQSEANRLSSTIDDLLALSRLESGPVDDPETIDLLSVAAMAMERTSEAAEQQQVRVELRNQDRGSVLIDGDQGQLVSAVANLVENAIKYSDAGGEVAIEVGTVVRGDSGPEGGDPSPDGPVTMAELSVIDTGIGIPDRDLERIFERFYRVDSARSRQTGGTGLGLSIVRHALINHKGEIDVESAEGQGSTFTIRLPLSSAQVRIAPRQGSTP